MTPKERAETLRARFAVDGYTEQADIECHIDAIERVIIAAIEEEREQCAEIGDYHAKAEIQSSGNRALDNQLLGITRSMAREIAARIRARGEKR